MSQQAKWFSLVVALVMTAITCACGIFTDYDFDQPNTHANQVGFERHFGFSMPASVSDLYYFADELGADVKYQLGFTADQGTVERIVAALDLVQREPKLDCTGLIREFDWWSEDAVVGITPYWKSNRDGDYYWLLWFDPSSQKVYYLEFSL